MQTVQGLQGRRGQQPHPRPPGAILKDIAQGGVFGQLEPGFGARRKDAGRHLHFVVGPRSIARRQGVVEGGSALSGFVHVHQKSPCNRRLRQLNYDEVVK